MFNGEIYSDFVVLWLTAHATRFQEREAGRLETCWLEEWTRVASKDGTRILGALRQGVEKALETLGQGFVGHPQNRELRDALQGGTLSLHDFHAQLLRLVYRLIFLFVAEDRVVEGAPLLHPRDDSPEAREARARYAAYYGTKRLRRMAAGIRGSRHGDLWQQFNLLVGALSGDERFEAARRHLSLPSFGSFLWSPANTAAVGTCGLTNGDFLEAIRQLAFTRQDRSLRPVDYRNLGAEELGGVYESLLALTPQIGTDGKSFSFAELAGNERKTSGSYYTPDSLVQCLLDSALDPVVEEAIKGKSRAAAEQAILSLKVCDPAVGSGHFLVGAAHRLARHLARVRALAQGESEPSPLLYQHALRDVIGRCLYGVDVNPMAAELCRVSLWLEALEPGKPLSFLDHHIRVGNSLVGATPELIAAGLPDDAFAAIEGDDKKACAVLKQRNKAERKGPGPLFLEQEAETQARLQQAAAALEGLPDDRHEDIRAKERAFRRDEETEDHLHKKRLADAWCAAFVIPKRFLEAGRDRSASGITQAHLNDLANGRVLPADLTSEVQRLSDHYQFFHWHLAFPEVFRQGGFDCVLGNPPWERIKLAEDEWFASTRPDISSAPNAGVRTRLIESLREVNPGLHARYVDAVRDSEGVNSFARHSGAFPLCGVGDINTYALFAELNRHLVGGTGRVGCILQAGIATDKTTSPFFADLIMRKSLVSLYSFDNHEGLFPSVKSSTRFCLVTLSGASRPFAGGIRFTFYARRLEEILDPDRYVVLTARDLELLNPNTLTCPVFQSKRDSDIVSAIYRRIPVVVNERLQSDRWQLTIRRVLDMNKKDTLDLCLVQRELPRVGVYEAKLFDQMNHRRSTYDQGRVRESTQAELQDPSYALSYRYNIGVGALAKCLPDFWGSRWLLVWQDITDVNTMARSVSSVILPLSGTDFTIRVGFPQAGLIDGAVFFVSAFNSFVFDYVARQKIGGTHLSDYILKQLPLPPPESVRAPAPWDGGLISLREWLIPRVLELTYTGWEMEPFARDCGWEGSPFRWEEERRFLLRCELDAALFHLYLPSQTTGEWRQAERETVEELARVKASFSTPRDAVSYMMDSFSIVRRKDEENYSGDYLTKRFVLEIYDAMQEAIRTGRPYQTRVDPRPRLQSAGIRRGRSASLRLVR